MVIWRVMGLLWERMDGLQEFWGVGRGWRSEGYGVFDEWVEKLGLKGILDLPSIALSNGQTMRARIAQTAMKAPEGLLLDKPSSELLLPFVSCVFLPPIVVHFIPSRNSFLPSISSFLPFYFFLACTHLSYLSALFLFLLALLPFIDLLFVRSSFESLGSFSTFPCSHLFPQIFLRVSAFSLHFSPSPSLTSPPSSLPPPAWPLLVSLILILTPPFSLI